MEFVVHWLGSQSPGFFIPSELNGEVRGEEGRMVAERWEGRRERNSTPLTAKEPPLIGSAILRTLNRFKIICS